MKHLIRLVLIALAVITSFDSPVAAQGTVQAIAFEKATRDTIFIKMPDSAAKPVLFSAGVIQLRKLAMLASTPDGKNFLVAASLGSEPLSYTGILNVPSNLDSIIAANPNNQIVAYNAVKRLWHLPGAGLNQFRPVGVLSPDGKEWWVNFVSQSTGGGLMRFYHGRMDKDEVTDPSTVIDSAIAAPSSYAISDYHMSNLALGTNNTMIAVSVDNLNTPPNLRYIRYRWDITNHSFNLLEFQNQVANLNTSIQNADSLFAFALRVLPDGQTAELGLANVGTRNNSLSFYQFPVGASNISLGNSKQTIDRSVIPDSVDFFAGPNIGSYQENNSDDQQIGNSGDMMYTADGSGVIFTTHGARENGSLHSRDVNSAIYQYNFGDASASVFYNDTSAQELQPVFVTVPLILPAKPGEAQLSLAQLSFGTVDTGNSAPLTISITDTGANPLMVDSVRLIQSNGGKFVLSGGVATPYTLTHGQSQTYTVTFVPTAPAGNYSANFVAYYNGKSMVNATATGTAKVKPAGGGGVAEDPTLAPFFAVSPNPFAASTTIRLTAPAAGDLGIVVHNELGRAVYTSDSRKAGIGSVESFTFDPSQLGLSAGVYYVTAVFGDKQITRQLRYSK